MKRISSVLALGASLLLLAFGQPQAHACDHPCLPTTQEELDTIQAFLDQAYWKSDYAARPSEAPSACGGGRQALNLNRKGQIL